MKPRDLRSIYMPYCLQKQADGFYAVLNRNYKPVGFNTMDFIDYNDFPVTAKIKGIGPGVAKKLSCTGSENTEAIFLYNGGCVPTQSTASMGAYLKRYTILAKLEVKT
jgi:hypothetical protein